MHPAKVCRERLVQLTDLPNVGPAMAADYRLLGFMQPAELVGQSAWQLYQRLNQLTGQRHDPCVLDVLLSVQAFLDGAPAQAWWAFTAQRKHDFPNLNPP